MSKSSKKQNINEIRRYKTNSACDAKSRPRHRMHQTAALAGLKDMYEPWFRCFFPHFAHISGAEFQYPDLTWKELCGQMALLIADSRGNKMRNDIFTAAKLGL